MGRFFLFMIVFIVNYVMGIKQHLRVLLEDSRFFSEDLKTKLYICKEILKTNPIISDVKASYNNKVGHDVDIIISFTTDKDDKLNNKNYMYHAYSGMEYITVFHFAGPRNEQKVSILDKRIYNDFMKAIKALNPSTGIMAAVKISK